MKIHVGEHGTMVVEEAFVGFVIRTTEGNEYGICQRDDTIEVTVIGDAPEPRVYPAERGLS